MDDSAGFGMVSDGLLLLRMRPIRAGLVGCPTVSNYHPERGPCARCGDRDGRPVTVGDADVTLCETCHGVVESATGREPR